MTKKIPMRRPISPPWSMMKMTRRRRGHPFNLLLALCREIQHSVGAVTDRMGLVSLTRKNRMNGKPRDLSKHHSP
jgi:hypothetical protein